MGYYISHLNQIYNGADPSQFATVGCLHRKLVSYRDRFGFMQSTPVDCGKCERCQDDRRNQWAARMWLHTIDSPWIYVYFVTLTYSPFDHTYYKKHPYMSDWLASYPVQDAHNKYNKMGWCPSVLCLTHIQKYLKRLRKAAIDISPISYAYCGEYGESYARPHWHLILYSQKPLPDSMIRSAWGLDTVIDLRDRTSVLAYRGQTIPKDDPYIKRSHFSMGRVDIADLAANGSLYNSTLGGTQFNAMYNFAYVAKYLGKPSKLLDDFIDYDERFHRGEVKAMESKQTTILLERFVKTFGSFPLSSEENCPTQYDHRSFTCSSADKKRDLPSVRVPCAGSSFEDPLGVMDSRPFYSSSKRSSTLSILDGLKPVNFKRDITLNGALYENLSFEDFSALVSPCFHSSTRYCLGKEYGVKNLKRFASGNKELPKWRAKCITFPRYFSYLMELEKCPVRFESATFSSRSFTHENLSLVREYFDLLSINPRLLSSLPDDSALIRRLSSLAEPFDFSGRSIAELNSLCVSMNGSQIKHAARPVRDYCEVVLKYVSRTFRCVFNVRDDVFELYEYDRKSRTRFTESLLDSDGSPIEFSRMYQNFHLVDVVPREEFCEFVCSIIDTTRLEYDASARAREAQLELFSFIEECPDSAEVRERWRSVRHRDNKQYSINHIDIN